MTRRLRILGLNILFVFRHKWDNPKRHRTYDYMFRNYELGIWFKKCRIVGKKDFRNPKAWANNMVNDYTFGINLLVCKFWVSVNYNGKILTI